MIKINQHDLSKILEVNENYQIEEHHNGNLFYITIDDFFKNPDDLVDFLVKFPADNFEDALNNNLFDFESNSYQSPPGIQQIIHPQYFQCFASTLLEILCDCNYLPNTENKSDDLNDGIHFNQVRKFSYYTNCISSKSVSFRKNNLPHIDQSRFTFNFHLSKNVTSGLNFYKLKLKEKRFSNIKSIMEESNEEKNTIKNLLNDNLSLNEESAKDHRVEPFKSIEENDLFVLYEQCDFKFNRLVLYESDYWHSINHDSTVESNPRYSLVSTYNYSQDEIT
jgi:hypothetical protein